MDSLEHFRGLTPDGLTRDGFFAMYVHAVLVSGLSPRVVENIPRLGAALMDYDCDAIANSPGKVRLAALRILNNEPKIDAIISMGERLADSD